MKLVPVHSLLEILKQLLSYAAHYSPLTTVQKAGSGIWVFKTDDKTVTVTLLQTKSFIEITSIIIGFH